MPQDIEFIQSAFESASNDHSRIAALDLAAQEFRDSKEKSVMVFLAETALDKAYSKDVRLVAYLVLYEVSARDLCALPDVHLFKMPEDLDLSFLHECLR
jgi:hypothetical protein